MSDEAHIESVIREADAWLECHKVTETWRTMNRLRDTLVRLAGQSQGAKSAAFDSQLNEAKAQAWDDGFTRGFYDPLAGADGDASESGAANPYRKGN